MKSKRLPIFLLVLYTILLIMAGIFQPRNINWTPTFSADDKIPFGNFILYQQLSALFPKSAVAVSDKPFYNFDNEHQAVRCGFIVVNNQTNADALDIKSMVGFVRRGGSIFIATNDIPRALEDSLGIRLVTNVNYSKLLRQDTGELYHLNFKNPLLKTDTGYAFAREYVGYQIVDADSVKKEKGAESDSLSPHQNHPPHIILGVDENEKANFVKVPLGIGSFYIHSFPFAFTNYQLLKSNNSQYVAGCLSYLNDGAIFWDEYYKPNKFRAATTPLRFILSTPAYKWAYYLVIFSLLAYVFVFARRRQRIIPVIEPFKNLSLEFARTIGTLYYQQKDHKDLAEKKMVYFLEKVRNNFLLPTNLTNESFQQKLAFKSNVAIDTIKEIFDIYYNQIRENRTVNEATLIAFNSALENFYTQSGLTNK